MTSMLSVLGVSRKRAVMLDQVREMTPGNVTLRSILPGCYDRIWTRNGYARSSESWLSDYSRDMVQKTVVSVTAVSGY